MKKNETIFIQLVISKPFLMPFLADGVILYYAREEIPAMNAIFFTYSLILPNKKFFCNRKREEERDIKRY